MDFTMQELYKGVGEEGQKKLKNKTVTIIGLGGIGSTVLQILARNGVNLRIIDRGRILEKDLPRQTLFRLDDVTKFKAKQAKKILEELNNEINVKVFHEDLNKDNLFLIESDLIVDLTNNLSISVLINKFALEKRIPYIFANFAGDKGHLLIVDRAQSKKKGPCVDCIKDKLKFESLDDIGVYSPITHMVAALVANAVFKNLLDIGNITKLLSVDIMKTEIRHCTVERDKKCEVCLGK